MFLMRRLDQILHVEIVEIFKLQFIEGMKQSKSLEKKLNTILCWRNCNENIFNIVIGHWFIYVDCKFEYIWGF